MSDIRALALATVALISTTSAYADATARVRGTVDAITDDSITVTQKDGQAVTLKTGSYTSYADVVPANLDAIKLGEFIGTATKGPRDSMVAVEVVLIPKSMRAGRIGYYAWDALPDTTVAMNSSVSGVSPGEPPLTKTSMSNGVVSVHESAAAGLALTITYDGDKILHIVVPPTAPIVRFVPADRSTVDIGAPVFIKTDPGSKAGLVAVGKGVVPPM